MKVKELIEKLKQQDPEMEVVQDLSEDTLRICGYGVVTEVKLVNEPHQSHDWPEPRVRHDGPAVLIY